MSIVFEIYKYLEKAFSQGDSNSEADDIEMKTYSCALEKITNRDLSITEKLGITALEMKNVKVLDEPSVQSEPVLEESGSFDKLNFEGLEKKLTSECEALPRTNEAFAEFILATETRFADSVEKQKLSCAVLVKICNSLELTKYVKVCASCGKQKGANALLAIESAKLAAASDPNFSAWIGDYNIEDEKARIEIAEIAANRFSDAAAMNIDKYKIKEEFHPPLVIARNEIDQKPLQTSEIFSLLSSFSRSNGWGDLSYAFKSSIFSSEDPYHQRQTLLWAIRFLGRCAAENISPEQFSFLTQNGFAEAVLEYRDPSARRAFIETMVDLAKNKVGKRYLDGAFERFKKANPTSKLESIPAHATLPLLLLASLRAKGVSEKVCDAHFQQGCISFKDKGKSCTFKDSKYLKVYVNALKCILETDELDPKEKEYLLDKILKEPSLIPCLRTITAIGDLGEISSLKKENLKKTTFSEILRVSFQKNVPMKLVKNFDEQFSEHFSKAREPNYITVYAAKLKSFEEPEKREKLLQFLGTCVERILEGTFLDKRYDLSESLHLKTVFETRPKLFEEWKKGEAVNLASFFQSIDPEKPKICFRAILGQIIECLDLECVPYLRSCLKEGMNSSRALIAIEEAVKKEKELQKSGSKECHFLSLQINCIKLIDDKFPIGEKRKLLAEISNSLSGPLKNIKGAKEFLSEIAALSKNKSLQEEFQLEEKFGGYSIVDTDDSQDLYLCGTEVAGSCQSISGNAVDNQGLMAYVMDGKNRLLAIKDKEGKIIARHILRVLLDGDQPVLFLERLYPSVVGPELEKALELFAKNRAKKLGLKLMSQEVLDVEPGTRSISSLSSPALAEHSDGKGCLTNGKFTVKAHVVK